MRSVIRTLLGRTNARASARRPVSRFRPSLEALEARAVPAVLPVTSNLDNGAVMHTLRWAVANARDGDTILLTPALGGTPIVLSQGELSLGNDVTITAVGRPPAIISGGGASRIFSVMAFAEVNLTNLTITDGSEFVGGGIFNLGTLTVSDCTLSGNTANFGGGIFNNIGTVTVSGCTFSDNSATQNGGAIYNNDFGTMTVSDSTLSENSALLFGGGVVNLGTMMVSGCTLSGNSAFSGGGIVNFGTLNLAGTAFSMNGPDHLLNLGIYNDLGGNIFD